MTTRQTISARLSGIRVVAAYELRVRHRASGWRRLLALWFVLVGGLTAAVAAVVGPGDRGDGDGGGEPGAAVFGYAVVLLLALLLLVVPTLARPPDGRFAEGARTAPQLAGLEAAELALGELLAAWAVVATLVVLATPALAATMLLGGVTARDLAAAAGSVAAVSCCVAALSQWRPGWTYAILLALSLGTPFAYSAALPVTKYDIDLVDASGTVIGSRTVSRPEKVWWILAGNPFVTVADAARPGLALDSSPPDPLTDLSATVRDARGADGPVWPQGLVFLTIVGTLTVGVTSGQLRTRQDKSIVR